MREFGHDAYGRLAALAGACFNARVVGESGESHAFASNHLPAIAGSRPLLAP
jgi:alkylated DNA nucleotide flippase Atl1